MFKWFKIKARDTNMSNMMIEFHLAGIDRSDVEKTIKSKGYTNIQSIEEDKDFENNLK